MNQSFMQSFQKKKLDFKTKLKPALSNKENDNEYFLTKSNPNLQYTNKSVR